MQSINFYFDEYHPKPISFNSRFALVILIISLIMMVIFGLIKSTHASKQENILAIKNEKLAQTTTELTAMKKELDSSLDTLSIDEQILKEQTNLKSLRDVLLHIANINNKESMQYSQILKQLSEQKTNALWLTDISVNANNLSIKGSTTNAETIPLYVEQLKQSSALKREFDDLNIDRDEDNKRLINFSLSNGRLSSDE